MLPLPFCHSFKNILRKGTKDGFTQWQCFTATVLEGMKVMSVIITNGFKEVGAEGLKSQNPIVYGCSHLLHWVLLQIKHSEFGWIA